MVRHELLETATAELRVVNEELWDIEGDVRSWERDSDFGARFVERARSVYKRNDHRAAIKRRINELLGSAIFEVRNSAFSVARWFCDDGRRDGPPWPPLFKGGKLGATYLARHHRSSDRVFSTGQLRPPGIRVGQAWLSWSFALPGSESALAWLRTSVARGVLKGGDVSTTNEIRVLGGDLFVLQHAVHARSDDQTRVLIRPRVHK